MFRDKSDRLSLHILAGVFFVCFVLLFRPFSGGGYDPVGYYASLSSLVFDGDVDIENDWTLSHTPFGVILIKTALIGPKGLVKNEYAVGCAVLWFPFHFPVRIVGWCLDLLLDAPPAWVHDRYAGPYLWAVSFGTLAYGFLALVLIFATCRVHYPPRASLLATLGAALASPLPRYAFGEPAMSHSLSAFTVALLLYLCFRHRRFETAHSYLFVAGALALTTLVRWQNILFAVIPAAFWLEHLRGRGEGRPIRRDLAMLLPAGLVFALIVSIQTSYWWAQLGTLFTMPQGQSYMAWTSPRIGKLLFSGWHGLYYTHPLLLVATAGLGFYWFQNRKTLPPYGILLAFFLMTYVNAAVIDWFGAGSFGSRRFCSCIPFFAVGLAACWNLFRGRLRWIPVGVTVAAVGWNVLLLAAYTRGIFDAFFYGEFWALRSDWLVLLSEWLPTIPLDSDAMVRLLLRHDYLKGVSVLVVGLLLIGGLLFFVRRKGFLFLERHGVAVAVGSSVAALALSVFLFATSPSPDPAGILFSEVSLPRESVSHLERVELMGKVLETGYQNPIAHILAANLQGNNKVFAESLDTVHAQNPRLWANWVLTLPLNRTTEVQRREAQSIRKQLGHPAQLFFAERIGECQRSGNVREERRWLRRRLRYDPFDFASVQRLSTIYRDEGRHERARPYVLRLRRYLESKMKTALANENQLGQWKEAFFQGWYRHHAFSLTRLYEEEGELEKAQATLGMTLERIAHNDTYIDFEAHKLFLDFILDDLGDDEAKVLARFSRRGAPLDSLLVTTGLCVQHRKPEKAFTILEIGFKHFPDNHSLLYLLRQVLGLYAVTDIPFDELLSAKLRSTLYWSCVADYLDQAGRLGDALNVLKGEFRHSPNDGHLAFWLREVLQRHPVAEVPFAGLLSADLDSAEYWLCAAEQLNRAERHEEALKILERSLSLRPDHAWTHYVRGRALLGLERLSEAEAAFRRAFELSPHDPTCGMSLSRVLARQGRHDEARKVVDRLVKECEDKSKLTPWQNEIDGIRNAAKRGR